MNYETIAEDIPATRKQVAICSLDDHPSLSESPKPEFRLTKSRPYHLRIVYVAGWLVGGMKKSLDDSIPGRALNEVASTLHEMYKTLKTFRE